MITITRKELAEAKRARFFGRGWGRIGRGL